jgi:Tfp pilus assembly protein PilF
MSLLLEALKKAERAKEEAQRRAREDDGDGAETGEAERKPVVTRDNLPDISPTLEIASEDLGPAPTPRPAPAAAAEPAAERPALELAPDPEPAPPPRSSPPSRASSRPAAATTSRQSEEQTTRAAARKVFEAKFREPNPKMPFYITLGALGVFAVGTVVYFWYQLSPPPPLVNLNPQRPPETALAATEARPVPTPAPVAAAPAGSEGPLAGLPSAASVRPSAPEPQAEPRGKSAPVGADTPRLATPRATARAAPAAEPERVTTATPRAAPQVNPKVAGAYSAYQAGDLSAARSDYEQALRDEPGNRDALLGLAALDVRGGRYESAEAFYLRVLQVDPRDPQALAALIALRSARADPLVTESRVKSLLAADPGAHALNFALGNQLAQQNRWAEAQQEYFKAYAAEPENADLAYNLAVSLDHLRQPKAALEYYQRAIALGARSGASFDLSAARARAEQLAR